MGTIFDGAPAILLHAEAEITHVHRGKHYSLWRG